MSQQATPINWNDLVRAAVLGTDNTQLNPLPPAFGHAFSLDIEGQGPQALLERLSLFFYARKAGHSFSSLPGKLPPLPPAESRPFCHPKVSAYFLRVINGYQPALLTGMVTRIAQRKLLLPPIAYPLVFEQVSNGRLSWQDVNPVLGHRAQWLALQHPTWRDCYQLPEGRWDAIKAADRLAFIKLLNDKDPKQALNLLQNDWTSIPLVIRKRLMTDFLVNSKEEHIPLLELILQDKSKILRQQAMVRLSSLPVSAQYIRIKKFLRQCIQLNSIAAKQKLKFTRAEDGDGLFIASWLEPAKWLSKGLSHEFRIITQLISVIHPSLLEDALQAKPQEIIQAAANSENGELLVQAMLLSATTHRTSSWMVPLGFFWFNHYHASRWKPLKFKRLLNALTASDFNRLAIHWYRHQPDLGDESMPGYQLIKACQWPWSQDLAELFFSRTQQHIKANPYFSYHQWGIRDLLNQAALHCPAYFLQGNPLGNWSFHDSWAKPMQDFQEILSFRAGFLHALDQSGTQK